MKMKQKKSKLRKPCLTRYTIQGQRRTFSRVPQAIRHLSQNLHLQRDWVQGLNVAEDLVELPVGLGQAAGRDPGAGAHVEVD